MLVMLTIIIKNLGDCKYHTSTAIDSQIATDRSLYTIFNVCVKIRENFVIFFIDIETL